MAGTEHSLEGATALNRVQYQGVTYSICTRCNEVIGSGRIEKNLLAAERFHHCAAMRPDRGMTWFTQK